MSAAAAQAAPTRRLTVTACSLLAEGQSGDRPWKLFRVAAHDCHGRPVEYELRSFEELTPGLTDDFQIVRRTDERYGTSYTLKRRRGRLNDRVTQLEHQVSDHEHRLARLESAPPY